MPFFHFTSWCRTQKQPQSCESTGYFEPLRDLDVVEASGNPLHIAAELGNCDAVIELLAKEPGLAEELNRDGLSPLHLACQEGHLVIAKNMIRANRNLCFGKDKNGQLPLHMAAMKGKIEVLKVLVDACPESVKEVSAMGETCLHVAVVYNKGKIIQYLVKWLVERTDYGYLINEKDRSGNTVLHLATSRKQLHTLKLLLTDNPTINKLVEVNSKNFGGFTPLDILDVLPYSGKIDMEMDKILRRAGAMRARDITHQRINSGDDYNCRRDCYEPSHKSSINSIFKLRREACNAVLLLTATLLTTITYHAGFSAPVRAFKEPYIYNYDQNGTLQMRKQDSSLTRLFILFNSTGFISSVSVVIFLLHEFPMKPLPQISVSTMFGAYMCSIMAVSPNEALGLLFLAIPFLLLAAGGKLKGPEQPRPYYVSGEGDGDA